MTQDETTHVTLKVNDQEIEINSFVQGMIRNIVVGLISSLRLDGNPAKIELTITNP